MERSQAKILIVDDQQCNLSSMEAILNPLAKPLITARSGREALRLILEHEFAVILLDVKMPDIDGFETARIIRARDRTRHVPIIFLTAFDQNPEYMLRGYSLGAVDFIFKPISIDEILRSKVFFFVQLYEAKQNKHALEQEQEHVRQLQAIIDQYRHIGIGSIPTSNNIERGIEPLRRRSQNTFDQLVTSYGRVLALALESRAVNIQHDVPGQLRALSRNLGEQYAGPRDVVDMHVRALTQQSREVPPLKAQAMVEEGRFRVLELMGNLVSYYRESHSNVGSNLTAKDVSCD